MAKWANYSFRSTSGGSSTWSGGAIADPQDSTQDTMAVLPTSVYPVAGANGKSYGRTGGPVPSASDTSATNAGNNPLLGGSHTYNSGGQVFRIDLSPGSYDFRCAFGANAGSRMGGTFIDGTLAQWQQDTGATAADGCSIWVAQAAVTASTTLAMVSKTDGSFWTVTTAGTTGNTEPSIAGATTSNGVTTFADGTAVWTRLGTRVALLVVDGTTTSNSTVVDQNSTVSSSSAWGSSATRTITCSGTKGACISMLRHRAANGTTAGTSYLKQVGVRAQPYNLVDITTRDEFDAAKGTTPTIYAQQPAGLAVTKLVVGAGLANAAALSLSGDLASYFTLQDIDGYAQLVTNGTRIPDSLAGTRTLVVTQTDPNATTTTRTTTLNFTVVAAGTRPTDGSFLGQARTEYWLTRKKVYDAFAGAQGLWEPTPPSSGFVTDVLVTSGTEFQAAVNAINTTAGSSSWYRIRLGGTAVYTGNVSLTKNFYNGGLLIEPDAGADPELSCTFTGQPSGVYCRNFRMVPDARLTGLYQIRHGDPGPAAAQFLRIVYDNIRWGLMFSNTTYTQAQIRQANAGDLANRFAGSPLLTEHGQSLVVKNCRIDGVGVCFQLLNTRCVKCVNNDYKRLAADVRKVGPNYLAGQTGGVFPDNAQYVLIDGETFGVILDYSGFTSSAHLDFVQVQTYQNNASFWTAGKGQNVNAQNANGTPWLVGDILVNQNSSRIYRVASTSGNGYSAATGIGPSTTGTGIPDGDVTWDYVTEFVEKYPLYCVIENVAIDQSNQFANGPTCQFVINSNGGHFAKHYWVIGNNIVLTGQHFGVGGKEGEVWSYRNTFGFPSRRATGATADEAYITRDAGAQISDDGSIFNYGKHAVTDGTASYQRDGATKINWRSGAGPSVADTLRGSFSLVDDTYQVTTPIQTTDTVSQQEFRSQLSKAYHHVTGALGARLTELHTVTISDAAGASVTKTLRVVA